MAELEDLVPRLSKLLKELDKRDTAYRLLDPYYEDSECPMPGAVVQAGVTKAYRLLMPVSAAPWGSLIVDSVQDRLEVAGVRTGDKTVDALAWNVWQSNYMDSESLLGHNSALVSGRAFATVWPGADGEAEITLDSSQQVIVQYAEGNRRKRVAALRRWVDDDDRTYATLYLPDGLYKFVESKDKQEVAGKIIKAADKFWEKRVERDSKGMEEPWPVPNPFEVVNVVELPVNRRLKPGEFGHARGEFAHVIGLIDRINLLTFLGLVVAFWMGFPVRAVIGDKIIRDDSGDAIAPFKVGADEIVQFEDPATKLAEWAAADRKNLSVYSELDQLSTLSKTPRHYFPIEGGMSNLSADAIRASEGPLHAKVPLHKGTLGEGWEEVLRLAGMVGDEEYELPANGAIQWKDHETRSLAERADAATKLASIEGLPWQVVAEKALNLTQDEIARAEAGGASNVIGRLLTDAATGDGAPTVGDQAAA